MASKGFDFQFLALIFVLREIGSDSLKIGFCFSFPLKMERVNVGYIEQLTKVQPPPLDLDFTN